MSREDKPRSYGECVMLALVGMGGRNGRSVAAVYQWLKVRDWLPDTEAKVVYKTPLQYIEQILKEQIGYFQVQRDGTYRLTPLGRRMMGLKPLPRKMMPMVPRRSRFDREEVV